jgi:hypothetical protein
MATSGMGTGPIIRKQPTQRRKHPLLRVQSPTAVAGQERDLKYVADLFQRASSIITGAEGTACGLLGAVSGYALAHHLAFTVVSSGVGLPLGFMVGVAIYTLLLPPHRQLFRCLSRIKLGFVDEQITKEEYERLRARCLESHKF